MFGSKPVAFDNFVFDWLNQLPLPVTMRVDVPCRRALLTRQQLLSRQLCDEVCPMYDKDQTVGARLLQVAVCHYQTEQQQHDRILDTTGSTPADYLDC